MPTVIAPYERRDLDPAEWRLRAGCKGESTEQFYPADKERPSARRRRESLAKEICLACPVLESCRRFALATQEPHGVWGATTPRERERLLESVRASATAV